MTLPVDTVANSSFSRLLPGLQLAVDSTSLGAFKECPRKYYYSIICGYQPRQLSVHLTFGLLYHSALERYDHARAKGLGYDDACKTMLRWVLGATWDSKLGRPWISDHNTKNRLTLVRTLVWYLDQFGQEDPFETVLLASGKPAVELSFSFQLGASSETTGEPWLLCGHMDRIGKMNGTPYILDRKTTGHSLDAKYFSQFSPHNQFSLYVLAGEVAFGTPVRELVVDAAQIGVGFSRFHRGLVPRPRPVIEEWASETRWWLRQMETCAVEASWPQNDKSCTSYGGCDFQAVCSKAPASRQQVIDVQFGRRTWNPLERRGDI